MFDELFPYDKYCLPNYYFNPRKKFQTYFPTNIGLDSIRNAESSWYMDEPVMMKKRVDQGKLNIIAIFYKVCARDVKKQTCEFGENFWKLARASSGDQVVERMCLQQDLSFKDKSLIELVGSSIGLHPDSGGATLLRGGSTDPCDF
uniref:TIR domain-containing protein n=1 Tax=Brassica campestris TaxID=3711 RepID=M4EXJ2_BRACM